MKKIVQLGSTALVGLLVASTFLPQASHAGAIDGTWSLVADIKGTEIPFRLDIRETNQAAQGHFFDGAHPTNPSVNGTYRNGTLHLEFPSYAAVLDAHVEKGELTGQYAIGDNVVTIHGARAKGAPHYDAGAPNIDGEWIIPNESPKGEKAWRLIIHQKKSYLEASILRIDGDTGTLNGGYRDGAFRVSHYAGERPGLLILTPQPDGSLKLNLTAGSAPRELVALRPAQAAALGAVPTEPTKHTGVANAAEPFEFAFKDLNGQLVTNKDARFQGKVVLVNITGSWCPNCHDEAPFLEALYKKYGKDGLEIVALDFEPGEQLANPTRLHAFIKRYGLTYPVLLAGEPKEAAAKIPQASNLNAWPTTFFVGRDGLVKTVHVGFTSPGSGARDAETRAEVEGDVVALLGLAQR